MKKEGYKRFTGKTRHPFVEAADAKNTAKGFGVQVEKTWYWYDNWVEQVRKHCQDNPDQYN